MWLKSKQSAVYDIPFTFLLNIHPQRADRVLVVFINTSYTIDTIESIESTPKGRQGSYKRSDTSSSKVSYSGLVEWISPSGVFTSFREQGWKTTDNTTIIFSPLTPSTAYVFRVSVVTEDGQSGAEATSTITTSSETGGMHNIICNLKQN